MITGYVLLSKKDKITIAGDFNSFGSYSAMLFNSIDEAKTAKRFRKDGNDYDLAQIRFEVIDDNIQSSPQT